MTDMIFDSNGKVIEPGIDLVGNVPGCELYLGEDNE